MRTIHHSELPDGQAKFLAALQQFVAKKGRAPSFLEIGAKLRMTSNGAKAHALALEAKGIVTMDRDSHGTIKTRTLRVV